MKKEEKEIRKYFARTRVNNSEYNQLTALQRKNGEKTICSYVRKIILQKPVKVRYRNQSADDFLIEMLGLKKELNAISNNFNQAVHKLHLLDKIPGFTEWLMQYDIMYRGFVNNIEEIKLKLCSLYELMQENENTYVEKE
jgi:MobC-like protein